MAEPRVSRIHKIESNERQFVGHEDGFAFNEEKCDRCGANEVKAIVHSPPSMPPMNMEEFMVAKYVSENLCDDCMMDQCDEWDS